MGRNKMKEALERSRIMNTPIGGVNCACAQHRKSSRKFIPDVARKSVVRIFGASGSQVLPVWSGVSADYSKSARNNLVKSSERDYSEKELISGLIFGLKLRGGYQARFAGDLADFLKDAQRFESNSYSRLDKDLLRNGAYLSYGSLLRQQDKNLKNEIFEATIDYLKVRYPSLTVGYKGDLK